MQVLLVVFVTLLPAVVLRLINKCLAAVNVAAPILLVLVGLLFVLLRRRLLVPAATSTAAAVVVLAPDMCCCGWLVPLCVCQQTRCASGNV